MKYLFAIIFILAGSAARSQQSENLIIITLDGMRWQEVFGGAEDRLLANKEFTRDSAGSRERFWNGSAETRRNKLFPFIWGELAKNGRIYGSRTSGAMVNVANRYRFSYPGYNEIFTGFPDDSVNSNDKRWNEHVNVLEYINQQNSFKGKVASFATWDVFPYILNRQRSGMVVNADNDSMNFKGNEFKLIDDWQKLAPRPIGVRPDVITYMGAREYLKAFKPRVLYIAFDETDDLAHGGMYDQYLNSANAEDAMIADLWKLVNSMPYYKGKTTLLITCDHGRGYEKESDWRHHGSDVKGADQIWFAVIGPGISPEGEVKRPVQIFQSQFAASFAKFLGLEYKASHSIAAPIADLFK